MLIALLIITVGLLGMAGLQAYSLRNNTSAYHRSQANALAYSLLDSIRTNRPGAVDGLYAVAFGQPRSPSVRLTTAATAQQRANTDIANWKADLAYFLPAGDGRVACTQPATDTNVCTVTVQWDDTRSGTATQQISVSTSL